MRALPALLAGLVVFSSPALATRYLNLTVDQLTRNAAVILEGEVISLSSAWNADRTRIYTTVSIRVDQYHKGAFRQTVLDLRYAGGTVGGIGMAVVGQPAFERDERVFLFLKPNFEQRDMPLVGDVVGKFRVTADATGNDILLGLTATLEKSDVVREIRSVLRPIGQ